MELALLLDPIKEPQAPVKPTAQRLHHKASEHHALAAHHHTEAANCLGLGDVKSAAHHALIANGHAVQAKEQAVEASKKYIPTQLTKNQSL